MRYNYAIATNINHNLGVIIMKNKLSLLGMCVLLLTLLSSVAVFAQTPTVTAQDIVIGSNNQDASNPNDDDGPVVVQRSGSITFTNTGTTPVVVTLSGANQGVTLLDAKYTLNRALSFTSNIQAIENLLEGNANLLVVETPVTSIPVLAQVGTIPGTATLNFETMIPASLDAVNNNLEEQAFDVFKFTFLAGTTPLDVKVQMQRENLLVIDDSDIEIDSRRREDIDDADDVEDIQPGANVKIEMKIRNEYNDDSDVDVEDVDLEIECENEDDFDIDDNSLDLGDIAADSEETDAFSIDVEKDAEDGDSTCDVKTVGTDENGARMGQGFSFTLEITRETHDIQITSITPNPGIITCDDNTLELTIGLLNIGKSDEDEVAVEVSIQDFNKVERRSNKELDEDDEDLEVFSIEIPSTLTRSPIPVSVKSFYDNIKVADTELLLIENECIQEEEPEPSEPGTKQPPAMAAGLILSEDTIDVTPGASGNVAVQVTNNENTRMTFELSLDVSEFGTASAAKEITLQPGQTASIFLNFKAKEETGSFTGAVELRTNNQIVETKTFTAEVKKDSTKTGAGFNLGGDSTRVFWIIADIILVIVAIFFIRLIFTAGGKKKSGKKMSDMEAEAMRAANKKGKKSPVYRNF